jgi:uncharacterized protein (DUF58 family)
MWKGLRTRLERWLPPRPSPGRDPIRLDRRHIYILPTAFGYAFALMLLIMFLWSINYSNSMGFALTFLLSAVALNTMWRCHNTLLDLQITPVATVPVFAGQVAHFGFRLDHPDAQPRYGVGLQQGAEPPQFADLPAHGTVELILTCPAGRRGWLRPGRLRLLARFPLGLFQAWSGVEFENPCLIYPPPRGRHPLPIASAPAAGGSHDASGAGSEDFAGLRHYLPGDSPRHVAWKAAARTDVLLVKRFTDQAQPELWLDWDGLAGQPTEARLSQLCQWVLKADSEGWEYGLRLPGQELAAARGEGQRRRCLETLALYALPQESPPS